MVRSPDEAEIRALAVAEDARGHGDRPGAGDRGDAAGRRARRARGCCCSRTPSMRAAQHLYTEAGFGRLPDRDWQPGLRADATGVRPDSEPLRQGTEPQPSLALGSSGPAPAELAPGSRGLPRASGVGDHLAELLVHRAQQEVQHQAHAGHDEEPKYPGHHLAGRGWRRPGPSPAHLLPDASEQVVLWKLSIHQRPGQVVILGRPRGPLDVRRAGEPGALGVDLGGVGQQRLVADRRRSRRTAPGW